MSTKAKRHTHKYHRIKVGSTYLWACALHDCNHYMPKHLESMIPGKATICWSCGNETLITVDNIDFEEPVCNKCMLGLDPTFKPISKDVLKTQTNNPIPPLGMNNVSSEYEKRPICPNCNKWRCMVTDEPGVYHDLCGACFSKINS